MMKRSKKGFTLVELLVVIAIIAIIAAVAVPVTIGQINKSKVKSANNEAASIGRAIENVLAENAQEDWSASDAGFTAAMLKAVKKCEYITKVVITPGENGTVVCKSNVTDYEEITIKIPNIPDGITGTYNTDDWAK